MSCSAFYWHPLCSKQPGQDNAAFGIVVGHEYFQQRSCPSPDNITLCEAGDRTRSSGRSFLQYGLSGSILRYCRDYLTAQGYAELFNAFVICAPLDAANWKIMQSGSSSGSAVSHAIYYKPADTWGRVLTLNVLASDSVYQIFLREAQNVYASLPSPKRKFDPYPSADFASVLGTTKSYIDQQNSNPSDEVEEVILSQVEAILPVNDV